MDEQKTVKVMVIQPCVINGGVWHPSAIVEVAGEEAVRLIREGVVRPHAEPTERADAPPQRGEG